MRDFIDSQIAARQAKLRDLDRQRAAIEGEVRAFETMLAHLASPPLAERPINGVATDLPKTERCSPIPSEMTPGWRKILCAVDGLGRSFDAADIIKASEEVGEPTKMVNARSQIYQWDKKHIITRVRKGKYKLAPKGVEAIRKPEGPDASASEPSV